MAGQDLRNEAALEGLISTHPSHLPEGGLKGFLRCTALLGHRRPISSTVVLGLVAALKGWKLPRPPQDLAPMTAGSWLLSPEEETLCRPSLKIGSPLKELLETSEGLRIFRMTLVRKVAKKCGPPEVTGRAAG